MSKTIELKATGEKITFVHSSVDAVEMLVTFPENYEGPPNHRHVLQSETFVAIDGKLGLESDGNKIVLEPGQSFTVPANSLHRCYSLDGKEVRFKATFTPALHIEYILTEMFASSNRKNAFDPSSFDACYVLGQAKGEYYLGDTPLFIQERIFPVIAFIGKVFGLVKANPKNS